MKRFDLRIKAGKDTDALRPKIEEILRRYRLKFELRTSSDEEVCYDVQVPLELQTDRVSNAILKLDPDGHAAGRMGRQEGQEQVTRCPHSRESDHPARRRPDPAPAGRASRQDQDRHPDFPVRPRRAREGAGGGGRAGCRGAGADRPHQPRRREGPAQARAEDAGGRRHRREDRRRSAALPRQDDGGRRRALRARLQLHQARHRQEPQLRHRHQGSETGEGGHLAVRGRQHAAAVRLQLRPPGRQPGELAQAAQGVHRGREEAAADLRRQDQRSRDAEGAPGAGSRTASRSGCSEKSRRTPTGSEARKMPSLRLHVRAIVRDGLGRSSAARACASWSWTAAARSASSSARRRSPSASRKSSRPTGRRR